MGNKGTKKEEGNILVSQDDLKINQSGVDDVNHDNGNHFDEISQISNHQDLSFEEKKGPVFRELDYLNDAPHSINQQNQGRLYESKRFNGVN